MDELMEHPPLTQIGDVFRHMGPLLDKSALKVLAPKMETKDAQPAKRPKGGNSGKGKTKGRGKGKDRPKDEEVDLTQVVHTLGKLALRLDLQLKQQNLTCCLIFFINNREESVLQNLVQTTVSWKQMAEKGQATQSLRSALWATVIQSLLQRAQLLASAQSDDPMVRQAQKVGVLLEDKAWTFQEWNAHKQQMVQTKDPPKKMEAMMKCLEALADSSKDGQLVTSFHTLKPLPSDQMPSQHAEVQVYPWRLTLNPRDDDVWRLMMQLQGSSVWSLIGLRYKQANLKPSSLTQQLDRQLRALK
eukprot:s493_g3.t1